MKEKYKVGKEKKVLELTYNEIVKSNPKLNEGSETNLRRSVVCLHYSIVLIWSEQVKSNSFTFLTSSKIHNLSFLNAEMRVLMKERRKIPKSFY